MNTDDQSIKDVQEHIKRFWVYYDCAVACCEADPKHPAAVFINIVGMGASILQLAQELDVKLNST